MLRSLNPEKSTGLFDEEKVKEQFEKDAENALPVLKEIINKDNSKLVNILIEGDI